LDVFHQGNNGGGSLPCTVFSYQNYPSPLKENLVTTKGHPTDNMNLLEDNILDDTPIVEIFNDPLFRWLSSYSKDSDI